LLGVTFANKEDYDKILEDDTISIMGLDHFSVDKPLKVYLYHKDGTTDSFLVNHTYNEQQIEWFKAGAALNIIRKEFEKSKK
jgi:aconitate hydratase